LANFIDAGRCPQWNSELELRTCWWSNSGASRLRELGKDLDFEGSNTKGKVVNQPGTYEGEAEAMAALAGLVIRMETCYTKRVELRTFEEGMQVNFHQ
jgi:hypothetical protein